MLDQDPRKAPLFISGDIVMKCMSRPVCKDFRRADVHFAYKRCTQTTADWDIGQILIVGIGPIFLVSFARTLNACEA